jgi:16S rRNA (guanine527-N7)-methyltransferase
MSDISRTQIESTLGPYIGTPDAGVFDKILLYMPLLLKWNGTISLTTVTDPMEIVKFHFGECLFALSMLHFEQSRLADVGSGAGFPGIPLAISVPSLNVTLIESNTKKCAFLSEVVRVLQLANATVFRGRMADVTSRSAKFDFVAARALGRYDDLLVWSRDHLSTSGRVALWLGESDVGLISQAPTWNWYKPVLIPGSKQRYLLSGFPRR